MSIFWTTLLETERLPDCQRRVLPGQSITGPGQKITATWIRSGRAGTGTSFPSGNFSPESAVTCVMKSDRGRLPDIVGREQLESP